MFKYLLNGFEIYVFDFKMLKKREMSFSFVFMLNVPVINFSVVSGRSHRFLGITYYQNFSGSKCGFAQGHNMAEVGMEPPNSRSGVRDSTTRPPPFFFVTRQVCAVSLEQLEYFIVHPLVQLHRSNLNNKRID